MTLPPANIGMSVDEVDTPALIVDLDAFEANLRAMADFAEETGVRLRPHAKTHKCAAIALRQMALGAVGVCCQKVSEAEALVRAGVPDVLVSNQVVGARKLERLAALAGEARLGVCVDDAGNVDALAAAVRRFGTRLKVLVEIDVGAGRCGVAPGEAALTLARRVAEHDSLVFAGLQAYQGAAQHIRDFNERRAAIQRAADLTRHTVELLAGAGLACETVGGAGTGTFRFETASGVWNELQVGSYIFMDADYKRNLDEQGRHSSEFQQSLYVLATVMSHPRAERAVVDAGLKALSVDSGLPEVAGLPGAIYRNASDEHGTLDVDACNHPIHLGERVRLIPGHCDPTVNLYDWLVGVREQRVAAFWPVTARGAVQ